MRNERILQLIIDPKDPPFLMSFPPGSLITSARRSLTHLVSLSSGRFGSFHSSHLPLRAAERRMETNDVRSERKTVNAVGR